MTSRWDDVERIVHAALERAPHERASFVAAECAGDDALRAEVESLLARESQADHLLSTPAAALMATSEDTATFLGRQFGTYTVLELIGVGGMGEVYRARDHQLDRDVAIKILPPVFMKDPDRLVRFEREAKILAALNHPHIGSIYGLERVDGVPALVLELVEGPTLAERLSQGALNVTDAIAISIQIADALDVAHRPGIIHRDLKPANIKVTTAGVVKLLDFGLAKAVEHDALTVPVTMSRPGAVLGTAAYMSPEQARGEPVDARSDLFSLGAVVYEMVTGRPPFGGETASSILRGILNDTPPSPRTVNPAVPVRLDHLVMRLLAKDRQARPQRAADVRSDLQRLARELESGPYSTLRRWLVPASAAAALIIAVIVSWASRQPAPGTPVEREFRQLTHFADSATSPALSSDGRMLTFIRGPSTFSGRGEIYVKALPDGEPIQLTSDKMRKMSPAFSPDRQTIVYSVTRSEFVWDTWTVPARGGVAREWIRNASGLTWFPKGPLLFSEITNGLHMQVIAADEQRNGARLVYSPGSQQGMAHRTNVSPDGASALVVEMDDGNWLPCRLVPSSGKSPGRRVGPDGPCTSAAWSPDGRWMYFSSSAKDQSHIWRQQFPEGTPEQLTFGPTEEDGVAVDPDGRSLLTSAGTRLSSVWIRDRRGEREISREGYAFIPNLPNGSPSQPLTPNTRLVVYLVRQGAVRFAGVSERAGELWATDVETGGHRAILPGRQVIGYDISRDGTQVVFAALEKDGSARLWLARLDGSGEARRLTDVEADSPRFDREGNIFYRATENGLHFIHYLREGRAPEKAVQQPVLFFMSTSPAGDWLIGRIQSPQQQGGHHFVAAFPAGGGPLVRLCNGCGVDWTPNGRYLVLRFGPEDDPDDDGRASRARPSARTFVVALKPGTSLPSWPANGVNSGNELTGEDVREFPDSIYPSDDLSTQVFQQRRTARNIYRVQLP